MRSRRPITSSRIVTSIGVLSDVSMGSCKNARAASRSHSEQEDPLFLAAVFTACVSSELIRVASVSMRSYGQLAYSRASQGTLGGADRSTLKGKRDYVIIALLVGCAPR